MEYCALIVRFDQAWHNSYCIWIQLQKTPSRNFALRNTLKQKRKRLFFNQKVISHPFADLCTLHEHLFYFKPFYPGLNGGSPQQIPFYTSLSTMAPYQNLRPGYWKSCDATKPKLLFSALAITCANIRKFTGKFFKMDIL